MSPDQIVVLENGVLRLTLEPTLGGRATSLLHLQGNHEALFVNPLPGRKLDPTTGGFAPWAWGWDECFPNVTPETGKWADHGELWNAEMEVAEHRADSVRLLSRRSSSGFLFERRFRLDGDAVAVELLVRNESDRKLPGFLTTHCLVALREGMRLSPAVKAADRKDLYEEILPDGESVPTHGTYSKFWVHPEATKRLFKSAKDDGRCAWSLLDPSRRMELRVVWDPDVLPYVAYWVTNAGFQGDRNAALELSDGFHDSMEIALRHGRLPLWEPGCEKTWRYRLIWRPLSA